jgi:acetyl-CoA acetyltransferase
VKGTKRVALVGAALSDIGRVDAHTPYELHYQAASRAIADAGLTKNDIDGLASSGTGLLMPVEIGEYLGLRPTWVDGTGVGGSTWEFMVEHATAAILAGHVEVVVLVYGSTTRADLKARRRSANLSFGGRGPVQFDSPFGHALIAKYAMAARRHMHEYGTTAAQLGAIAVACRRHANHTPAAVLRDKPLTLQQYLESPMLCDPFRKEDCCLISDGGGAYVMTSVERARDLRGPVIEVAGVGVGNSRTAAYWAQQGDITSTPQVFAAPGAFRMADLTPADVDVLACYDPFTIVSLMQIEDIGFCAKGEGGPFVEGTTLHFDGGRLPYNTHGGMLSHAYVLGIAHVVELVRQLRGEAAAQVLDARVAVYGGYTGPQASTLVLRRS